MFHLYLLLFWAYLAWRFVLPLPWSRTARVTLAAFLLLVSKYHLIQLWLFGTMFSPEIPRPLVILSGGLFCAFILLLLLVAMLDVLLLAAWALRRGRAPGQSIRTRARYAVACTALVLAAVGVNQAIQVPEVRRVELPLRGLPTALDGYRLVQLTDLHISRLFQAPWVGEVVARTNALRPDLIVITGDLIDGTPQARRDDIRPLAGLRARQGVIASLGNHEYYFGPAEWTAEFERLGMRVLVNSHLSIDEGDSGLVIAGTADLAAASRELPGPDLGRALDGAPVDRPVILLSHRPIDSARHAAAGVALQLSGHTHGGMVRGLDVTVVRQANGGFVSGLYAVGGMQLYVSNGTGLWNGFPIRLGVPAEITEFVLRPAAQ